MSNPQTSAGLCPWPSIATSAIALDGGHPDDLIVVIYPEQKLASGAPKRELATPQPHL
ncbi:MAG TPA: hypothetical protein VGU63_03115 [Candidatus Acidoferrales bacterium]|nr:hypothetical protein [Candidatus Acidoferrales bacterium]